MNLAGAADSPPNPPPLPGNEDLSVFPPSLHEGLHFYPDPLDRRSDPVEIGDDDRLLSFPTLREENLTNSTNQAKFSEIARRWIEAMRNSRVVDLGDFCFLRKERILSVVAIFGVIGGFWYLGRRRREKELVFLLVREKDQRISDLLNQIAFLNEIIAACHQVSIPKRS